MREARDPRSCDLSMMESTIVTARAVSDRIDTIKLLLNSEERPAWVQNRQSLRDAVRCQISVLEVLLKQYGQALQVLMRGAGHV